MALIAMAVHDTEENGRTGLTKRTLECLLETVDLSKHRIFIIDNNSCEATKKVIKDHQEEERQKVGKMEGVVPGRNMLITSDENLGTAKAINHALRYRESYEFVIKMDNDVVIHKEGWVDEMEAVMRRMPKIGILGLKRKDLQESTYAVILDQRSKLMEVPHEQHQPWYVVETCKHIMGTCTMLNPLLLDRIGYFYQMDGLYGFDDSLLCVRSSVAGFLNCFLHGIDIDHIDPGNTEYSKWKEKYAGEMLSRYGETEQAYLNGAKDIYYGGE